MHALRILGGTSWLQLLGWLMEKAGIEPTESQIRIGLVVLVVFLVGGGFLWCWLGHDKATPEEAPPPPGNGQGQ